MYKILLVEDDFKIAGILVNFLKRYGYEVFEVKQLDQVFAEFQEIKPDLVLLDINLPFYDGFHWCRLIRTVSKVPIIFISARTDEMNQVMAIEYGGDDYLTKPFHLEVVLAKIKSVLRRVYGEYAEISSLDHQIKEMDGLTLYTEKAMIEYQDNQVTLTQNELKLLSCLLRQYDTIVSREDLLEALWNDDSFVDDNTLTVNVTRVRRKLEDIGVKHAITTSRGKGYRLKIVQGEEK
ncbi:response regulator transcription factor [Peribacillus simplex]|uniref:DNA-binding response regulator n=2 Tax=Peribacillus simplex TaxID=1478 RepID=A0A223ED19_9BACI|nr:response regulator transcription factor [Peribacillus simplex]ASS93138.1 DNA-binding response regulator [Peribacillus simplex NBRC 15720 = DSM 1321]MEC1400722.1 response regulator transcription factor [Peribacillus simplex]MED3984174.1 response regulator transcription factor [Peribacillus simplex]MED4097178.1 response regulator transcription factor [Peribacillus simplex]TVX78631.1 response regulator transcription factor [Peribacillus simplex]